jgi:hypothetical protein
MHWHCGALWITVTVPYKHIFSQKQFKQTGSKHSPISNVGIVFNNKLPWFVSELASLLEKNTLTIEQMFVTRHY